jgi:hypothetical protein
MKVIAGLGGATFAYRVEVITRGQVLSVQKCTVAKTEVQPPRAADVD